MLFNNVPQTLQIKQKLSSFLGGLKRWSSALWDLTRRPPVSVINTNFPASVRILPPVTPLHSHGCLFTHTVHVNPAEHGPQYLEFARAFPRVPQSTWLGRNDDSPVSTATALTLKDLAEIHSESCGISTHCYLTQSIGYRHGCTNTEYLLELILDNFHQLMCTF